LLPTPAHGCGRTCWIRGELSRHAKEVIQEFSVLDANSRTAAVYRGSTSRRATVKPRGFETPPLARGTQRSTENTDGFPWHSYGTPAASKPHQTTPLTSRKWLSQHVASGVEQRINCDF
jgi:hypothetical protein